MYLRGYFVPVKALVGALLLLILVCALAAWALTRTSGPNGPAASSGPLPPGTTTVGSLTVPGGGPAVTAPSGPTGPGVPSPAAARKGTVYGALFTASCHKSAQAKAARVCRTQGYSRATVIARQNRRGGKTVARARTDAQGRFVLLLASGSYVIEARNHPHSGQQVHLLPGQRLYLHPLLVTAP